MLRPAERWYYGFSLGLGRLLRASRYSRVRIVRESGTAQVRKTRAIYAPFLIWMSGPLMWVLGTGVRVLPRREWVQRERQLYERLYAVNVREDGDTVLLPFLPGQTLAMLLEDVALDQRIRARAIELAVTALADFHSRGFTHGDAMAENVLVDVDAGVARWFDFETVHDSRRSIEWRRADDLRALLATCLLRSTPGTFSGTLQLVLDGYADIGVKRIVREHCASVWHRALTFHLGQAPLSFGACSALRRAVLSGSASPP